MTFSFNPDAEQEMNEAAQRYDSDRLGLGSEFLDEIEGSVRFLMQFPYSSPLVRRSARKKVVRRFPYNIYYSLREDHLRILAIAHHKRRPFYWRGRQ